MLKSTSRPDVSPLNPTPNLPSHPPPPPIPTHPNPHPRRQHRPPRSTAHDCTAPGALQATSLRLLHNVLDTIFVRRGGNGEESEAYRSLISQILDTFVAKLGTLRGQAPRFIA